MNTGSDTAYLCSAAVHFLMGGSVEAYPVLAVSLYEQVIDQQNDLDAMVKLAVILQDGARCVEADPLRAVSLYEQAIDQGNHPNAKLGLANLLQHGAGEMEADPVRAVLLYNQLINQTNNPHAKLGLAVLLQHGAKDVEEDPLRAVSLYEQVINQRCHPTAKVNLATIFQHGAKGVEADPVRAVSLYEQAIDEDNDLISKVKLAFLLKNGAKGLEADPVRAVSLYEQAIKEGNHLDAKLYLASLLCDGERGVEADPVRAVSLYEQAIDEGNNLCAMVSLALLLHHGARGVEADPVRAVSLLEQTINQGCHPVAKVNLAVILCHGARGVEADPGRAVSLYEQAIDQTNDLTAKLNLAQLLRDGAKGVESDPVRSFSIYKECWIESNVSIAGVYMAQVLLKGYPGVPRDCLKARGVLEDVIKDQYEHHAHGELGKLLWYGSDDISRDAVVAKRNFEEASRESIYWSIEYSRALLSDFKERDPKKAKKLLEATLEKKPGNPAASFELSRLLESGDDDIPIDIGMSIKLRKSSEEKKNCQGREALLVKEWTEYQPRKSSMPRMMKNATIRTSFSHKFEIIRSVGSSDEYLNSALVLLRGKPRQCLMIIAGGPARGKTSIRRSLKGMKFEVRHLETDLIKLDKVKIFPGIRSINKDDIDSLAYNSESIGAILSRTSTHEICELLLEEQFPVSFGSGSSYHSTFKDTASPSSSLPSTPALEEASKTKRTSIPSNSNKQLSFSHEHVKRVLEKVRRSISQEDIPEQNAALVQCWDLGGQDVYSMAHTLFVRFAPIILIAVDLERVMNASERTDEILELCRWLQLIYAFTTQDRDSLHVIIVGTRRSSCEDISKVEDIIDEELGKHLAHSVYNAWVREDKSGNKKIQFVAIENKEAVNSPEESGLVELEEKVKNAAEQVIQSREDIPLKWIAFIEEIEKLNDKRDENMLDKNDILSLVRNFPGFSHQDEEFRENEILNCLKYFQKQGRIVMYETETSSYVVFTDPSKIISAFRNLIGRYDEIKKRLYPADREYFERGLVTTSAMDTLWDWFPKGERSAISKIMCEVDLVLRVRDRPRDEYLISVPALHKELRISERNQWIESKNQASVILKTKFYDPIPPGLVGTIISYLHKNVGRGETDVYSIYANCIQIITKHESKLQVLFKATQREIVWNIQGTNWDKLVETMFSCVACFESFVFEKGLTKKLCAHFIVMQCEHESEKPIQHDGVNTVDFEIPADMIEWISGVSDKRVEFENIWAYCSVPSCGRDWWLSHFSELYESLKKTRTNHVRTKLSVMSLPSPSKHMPEGVIPNGLEEITSQRVSHILEEDDKKLDFSISQVRMGLSRIIRPFEDDIDRFGEQLKSSSEDAVGTLLDNNSDMTRVICFAISYVQHPQADGIDTGRFKFSDEQWKNLKILVMSEAVFRGIEKFRLWLDQCAQIRNQNKTSWANIRVIPYALWPVVCLETKSLVLARSISSTKRMWLFVEEITGLWGMGVFYAAECRSNYTDDYPSTRRCVSYESRGRLPPHETIKCMLMNIFHGAPSQLETGWIHQKKEIEEMARRNLVRTGDEIFIDGEWLDNVQRKTDQNSIDGFIEKMVNFQSEVYMEETKQIDLKDASGHNWLERWIRDIGFNLHLDPRKGNSDHEILGSALLGRINHFLNHLFQPDEQDSQFLSLEESRNPKVKIVTGSTVYYIVGFERPKGSIWFLLCVETKADCADSGEFENEEVRSVKVMSGKGINSKVSESVKKTDQATIKDVMCHEIGLTQEQRGDVEVTFI